MISTCTTVGEKYTFFVSDHYRFIENERIEEGFLIDSTYDRIDPFDYHKLKCGEDIFETKQCNQIHSLYPN